MDALVVEHIFITTMEPAQAITAAGELLARHRFVAQGRQGFAVSDDVPATAEFVRHKKSQFMRLTTATFLNRAQKVRLDFDRGRVTVAVAMDDMNSGDLSITKRGGLFGRSKRQRMLYLEQRYLVGIANALDARIARRDSVDAAEVTITGPVAEVTAIGRRQTRNGLIIIGTILLFFFGLIAFAIYASAHRW